MKAVLSPATAEHYEALRQNAVTREPIFPADPLGAILVVKNGVAGWMRRWDQVCGTASPDTPSSLPPPTLCRHVTVGMYVRFSQSLSWLVACSLPARHCRASRSG
jgi:hypothetical protein